MIVAWIVLAVGLLAFELHHLALHALFGAVGAVAGAAVAFVAPDAYLAQGAVAIAVSVAGIAVARPYVSRAFLHRPGGGAATGVHGGLVGQQVRTLDVVGDVDHPGHVRLGGERWLASSGMGSPIPPDTTTIVTAVRGTTLTVVPIDHLIEHPLPRPQQAPTGADEDPS